MYYRKTSKSSWFFRIVVIKTRFFFSTKQGLSDNILESKKKSFRTSGFNFVLMRCSISVSKMFPNILYLYYKTLTELICSKLTVTIFIDPNFPWKYPRIKNKISRNPKRSLRFTLEPLVMLHKTLTICKLGNSIQKYNTCSM